MSSLITLLIVKYKRTKLIKNKWLWLACDPKLVKRTKYIINIKLRRDNQKKKHYKKMPSFILNKFLAQCHYSSFLSKNIKI